MATGFKSGGRKKGTPNKDTEVIREAISDLVAGNIEKVQEWLDRVAEEDPKGAITLLTQLMEYKIPKLSRTELAGDKDNPVSVIDMSKWK